MKLVMVVKRTARAPDQSPARSGSSASAKGTEDRKKAAKLMAAPMGKRNSRVSRPGQRKRPSLLRIRIPFPCSH